MARKTKLTPDLTEKMCDLLRDGVYANTACAVCGIAESTFYNWMNDERELYLVFQESIEKAQAEAEHAAVAVVRHAAAESWQAAAWWLERKFPGRWARFSRLDINPSTIRNLTDTELEQRIAQLEQEADFEDRYPPLD